MKAIKNYLAEFNLAQKAIVVIMTSFVLVCWTALVVHLIMKSI